jgi:hypothetical protein
MDCPCCQTASFDIFWGEDGVRYGWGDKISWINNNDAPFGTIQRQMNVEIEKHDEDYYLFTIPCFPLKGWKYKVEYSYKSDVEGNILSRKRHYKWITSEHTYYMSGFRMLKYSLGNIFRNWRELRKSPGKKWCRDNLEDTVLRSKWHNAEWWRKFAGIAAKFALKTV